jgi:hypothetical protein
VNEHERSFYANLETVSRLYQNCISLLCRWADAVLHRKQHEGTLLCLRQLENRIKSQPKSCINIVSKLYVLVILLCRWASWCCAAKKATWGRDPLPTSCWCRRATAALVRHELTTMECFSTRTMWFCNCGIESSCALPTLSAIVYELLVQVSHRNP